MIPSKTELQAYANRLITALDRRQTASEVLAELSPAQRAALKRLRGVPAGRILAALAGAVDLPENREYLLQKGKPLLEKILKINRTDKFTYK